MRVTYISLSDASATWSACSCLDYLFTHLYKLSSASSKVSNGVSETNDAAPQRPLFVPTRGEASGAEGCGSIAQAARLQLTRSLSGVGACSGLGGCSALAIWSDLEEAGNANLRNHFLSSSASSQEFTARSRHLIAIFLASFMNDECKNQWSISRPLLCLILLNQEVCAPLMFFGLPPRDVTKSFLACSDLPLVLCQPPKHGHQFCDIRTENRG